MKKKYLLTVFSALMFLTSCENVDYLPGGGGTEQPPVEEERETYIHVAVANADGGSFMIDQDGNEVYNFDLANNLAFDVNLLDDGSLVTINGSKVDPGISFGGIGGKFVKTNADKTTEWEVEYISENYIPHHDVESLPNGNILFLAWELIESTDAKEEGFSGDFNIYPESIIEMNPLTEEIVWEWHTKDHLVQDHDISKNNYGVVADNPNKIDINYNSALTSGDIVHANGLTYDPIEDLIYVTAHFYDEVWVIDHSTTTNEASMNSGGDYGHGGDLVYRFGNPRAYDDFEADVLFERMHYPNILESGNILLFSNQVSMGQSEAVEFKLPSPLSLEPGVNNEPELVWSFTDEELYSNIMGSAVRMDNGNTLIAEPIEGTLWEVTHEGEVVWKYKVSEPNLWRAYVVYSNDPAAKALGIE